MRPPSVALLCFMYTANAPRHPVVQDAKYILRREVSDKQPIKQALGSIPPRISVSVYLFGEFTRCVAAVPMRGRAPPALECFRNVILEWQRKYNHGPPLNRLLPSCHSTKNENDKYSHPTHSISPKISFTIYRLHQTMQLSKPRMCCYKPRHERIAIINNQKKRRDKNINKKSYPVSMK